MQDLEQFIDTTRNSQELKCAFPDSCQCFSFTFPGQIIETSIDVA